MRFETSKATPPHLNRRLQLRMLGFVGMIGMIMFAMSVFQQGGKKPTPAAPLPGSPEVYQVQDDADRSLKPDEFVSDPNVAEKTDPNDPGWKEPPPRDQMDQPAEGGLDAEIAKLETGLDKGILRRVRDNTLGIRHDEGDAFYRVLAHASRVPVRELEKAGATDVLYINLMTEPDRYRGERITIQGDLWRLYEFQAGPNPFGLKVLYEAWIFTADSGTHPYRVVFTKLPKELEPGENLRKPVRVTGYFFKREGYASNGGMHVAPTLLAQRVIPYLPPNATPPTDAIVPYMIGLITAVGLAFLVTLFSFAISDRRAAKATIERELAAGTPSFAGIDGGPVVSVKESLRLLEEREWQAEADATNPTYREASAALHARDRVVEHPATAPLATEAELAERRRNGALAIQAWTNQQHSSPPVELTESDKEPVIPLPDRNRTSSEQVPARDDAESPEPNGGGTSKLAAWENEIQQFAKARESRMTEEKRSALEDVQHDRQVHNQERIEELQHRRVELQMEQEQADREVRDVN